MKLSKETLNVLSNFSDINSNLFIKTGSRITTIAPTSNILAETSVEESFPADVKLWDTNKLLNIVNMFDSLPDVDFEDKSLRVTNTDGTEVELLYADESLLTFQHESLPLETPLVSIEVDAPLLREVTKTASILGVSHVRFGCSDGVATLNVFNAESSDSDNVKFNITANVSDTSQDFELNFRSDELRYLLTGSYRVDFAELSGGIFSRWTYTGPENYNDLFYTVALIDKPKSSFGS